MNDPRPSEWDEGGPDDARTSLRLSLEELRLSSTEAGDLAPIRVGWIQLRDSAGIAPASPFEPRPTRGTRLPLSLFELEPG